MGLVLRADQSGPANFWPVLHRIDKYGATEKAGGAGNQNGSLGHV